MVSGITKSPEKWILPCGECGKERHYSTYKNWKRQTEITEYLGCKFLRISEDDSRSQVTLKVRSIL